eukprot:Rmarinus@m.1996
MKKRNFFSNATPILTFTLFGTVLSALLFAVCIYMATMLPIWINGNTLNWRECLIFGALIAPVDPVATLAIMKHANADPFLFSVTFGESMLNDPVSIIMYRTLEESHATSAQSFLDAFLLFLWVSLGSILIGVCMAFLSAIISKHVQFRNAAFDDTFVLTFAVLAYAIAEVLDASGIAAIFSAGIVMNHYTWYNLSDVGQLTVRHTIRTVATLAELTIFLNLGDFMTSFNHSDWEPYFLIFAVLSLVVSRGIVVFVLSFFLNLGKNCHHERYLSWRHQLLLAVSGLRGAFSFSLAVHLEGSDTYGHTGVIITTTLVLILFTVVVLGGLTGPLLRHLGLTCVDPSRTDTSLPHPKPGSMPPLIYVPEEGGDPEKQRLLDHMLGVQGDSESESDNDEGVDERTPLRAREFDAGGGKRPSRRQQRAREGERDSRGRENNAEAGASTPTRLGRSGGSGGLGDEGSGGAGSFPSAAGLRTPQASRSGYIPSAYESRLSSTSITEDERDLELIFGAGHPMFGVHPLTHRYGHSGAGPDRPFLPRSTVKEKFKYFDKTVLKPFFTRKLEEPRPRLLFDPAVDTSPAPLPRTDVVIANINDLRTLRSRTVTESTAPARGGAQPSSHTNIGVAGGPIGVDFASSSSERSDTRAHVPSPGISGDPGVEGAARVSRTSLSTGPVVVSTPEQEVRKETS